MRSTTNDSLTDVCEISRYSSVPDNFGGQTRTWATIATEPCRVAPLATGSIVEDDQAGRFMVVQRWVVTLNYDADVTTADRIFWQGHTFEVMSLDSPRSMQVQRRVTVSEVS